MRRRLNDHHWGIIREFMGTVGLVLVVLVGWYRAPRICADADDVGVVIGDGGRAVKR